MKHFDEYSGLRAVKAHRKGGSLPGVIRDADYLQAALRHAVCAFVDFKEYHIILCDLLDRYDESHEDYDCVSWLNLALDTGTPDSLMMAGYEALDDAEEILACITNQAERQCIKALRDVLTAPAKQQIKILGKCYHLSRPDVEGFMEGFFDDLLVLDLSGDEEDSYDLFLASVIRSLDLFSSCPSK